MTEAALVPVTLLTGFLGSGKTTVLNHLLKRLPLTAVVMNEFGEIGLDHQLLEETRGPLALLSGGCVCCQVQGSLAPTLKNLWLGRQDGTLPPFERIIIETTGIADPAPILETLLRDRYVSARMRMDGVVTTVDAVLADGQLDEHPEALRQIAVADRLLLTKTDLADNEAVAGLRQRLHSLNPAAPLHVVDHGDIDPALIMNCGLFRPEDKHPDVLRWLAESRYKPAGVNLTGLRRAPAAPTHTSGIRSFCISFDQPLDWLGLTAALEMLMSFRAKHILRMKALVNAIGEDKPLVLHAVQHVFHAPASLPEWPDADRRSRFVFITDDLDEDFVRRLLTDFALPAVPGLAQKEALSVAYETMLARPD
jgi:G3E family GTPase